MVALSSRCLTVLVLSRVGRQVFTTRPTRPTCTSAASSPARRSSPKRNVTGTPDSKEVSLQSFDEEGISE